MTSRDDERFMRLALKEAKKGLGKTSPNPCVGAVIVKKNRVIAQGYHKKAGGPHAEINALRQATEGVAGATLYVTLEPCNHTGKTPPCTQAIIESGISRVVVGMQDPNPIVDGAGLTCLQNFGIAVTSGILVQECTALNAPFLKHITSGLPWMIMKAGVSLDGRLNYLRGKSGWITGQQSIVEAHKLRNRVDAVLIGGGTLSIDNPSLTTRFLKNRSRDPIRVVVDSQLSTPLSSRIYGIKSSAATWVFHRNDVAHSKVADFKALGIRLFGVNSNDDGRLDLHEVLKVLGSEGLGTVMVEGGAQLHGALLKEKLYDYAHLFFAPVFAGDRGVSLIAGMQVQNLPNAPRLVAVRYKRLGDDIMISGALSYAS
jgi:diaminohydroxyphosphoribosylaminopyrimidine deaminase / 5-amino-6-(5-phosphoribosylamino)uracil reductase